MKDKCKLCDKVRRGKWALLFSPPIISGRTMGSGVWKHHICPSCYEGILTSKRGHRDVK